jgi:hypothetical protein
VGFDTNGDGSATSPAAGQWTNIKIGSTGSSTLRYGTIRYGGYSGGMLYTNGGRLNLFYSTATTSQNSVVYHVSGTTTITASSLSAGSYGLNKDGISSGVVTMTSTTLSDNTSYGANIDGSGTATLTENAFLDNTMGAVLVDFSLINSFSHSGNMASNNGINGYMVIGPLNTSTTWNHDYFGNSPMPYVIDGSFSVSSGKTLTIDPNVVVKFYDATSLLSVAGTLTVNGEYSTPTTFTSFKDDLNIGLDTNNDGTSTSPSAGDWDRITFPGGTGTFTYTRIWYGGSNSGYGALYNSGGTISVASSTIVSSLHNGLRSASGTFTATSTKFTDNDYGIYYAGGTLNISNRDNVIAHNTTYGLYNSTSGTTTAENIYWAATSTTAGTSTGPYHATMNPTGNGDKVSLKVDFSPWSTMLHFFSAPGHDAVEDEDRELCWDSETGYTSAWAYAVTTWNELGSINIEESLQGDCTFSLDDLDVSDVDAGNVGWVGQFLVDTNDLGQEADIRFNSFYMSTYFADYQDQVAVHELGHALGLDHSYHGNVMIRSVSPQSALGNQDILDYNYLWK